MHSLYTVNCKRAFFCEGDRHCIQGNGWVPPNIGEKEKNKQAVVVLSRSIAVLSIAAK